MERVLTERFRQESTDVWLERLRGSVPVARVNSVEEALCDEQVIDRGMIVDVPHPLFGMLRETASAVRFPDASGSHQPGSALGADTDDVLRSILGLDDARIDSLRASGAI
jgi:crotonobetainyl-CoA:carnitine CoA-transferase CaiB-like acyl-CoA transferase